MRIAIYSRKSKFTGKGESIENQIQLCRDYILKTVDGASEEEFYCYEDEGFSGKNLERPQFKKMMSDARETPFDYIVCYRLDRISRSVSDFSGLIETLTRQKTAFICIREQFDTSTPMGKAMMYIASVFAQLERETIAERIRDNLFLLSKTGRWLGGTTPLGFRSEKLETMSSDGKTRSCCKLAPVLEEQALVKHLFQKFLELKSLSGVAKHCVSHGLKTRKGKEFSLFTVREILSNPVYCIADADSFHYFQEQGCDLCVEEAEFDGAHGYMPYHRTSHSRANQGRTDPAEWVLALGQHTGLITGKEWTSVQRTLHAQGTHGKYGKRKSLTSPALLSGLLKCTECGNNMRPHLHSARSSADGKPAYYYICECKERSGRTHCTMNNVPGIAADRAAADALCLFASDAPFFSALCELRSSAQSDAMPNVQDEPGGLLAARLAENRTMIQNLVGSIARGGADDFSAALIREQINALHTQCIALEAELASHSGLSQNGEENGLTARCFAVLKEPREVWETAGVPSKKELLREIVHRIDWDGQELHLFLHPDCT